MGFTESLREDTLYPHQPPKVYACKSRLVVQAAHSQQRGTGIFRVGFNPS